MPQTRFVTRKALALGLKPIVVVNKIDRPGARPDWVVNHTFDLFDKLGATEEQLDFPIVYASALNGTATTGPRTAGHGHAPAVRRDPRARAGARRRSRRPAAAADLLARLLELRRAHRHRARQPRPHPFRPAGGGAARPGQRADHRQGQPGPGVQGTRARARRRSAGRRHRARQRHRGGRHRRHARRPGAPGSAAAAEGGRAHARHELPGQHLALRRARRQVRHQPPAARAPGARDHEQRRAARRGHRRSGCVQGVRPRRAAPHHPAREHAPRRLRAGGFAPARAGQGNQRRQMRAVRDAGGGRRGSATRAR